MKRWITLPLALAVTLFGCGDAAPSVEILSANPTDLVAGNDAADDLTIRIRYEDADGDLGGGVAEVHDCRAEGIVTRFELPEIASPEAVDEEAAIQGELSLLVPDVDLVIGRSAAALCADLGADATSFCVVLVDAAGHTGDGACTGPIKIQTGAP